MLCPGLTRRRRLAAGAVRLLLRLAGIELRVDGQAGAGAPRIFAANHASYLDGIVLAAAIPVGASFVVKRELTGNVFSRLPLERLGALFVERFDARESAAEAARTAAAVERGESLVIFPEGTFGRGAGVRPFHMGAFVTAAATATPVVPVAIRGSRSVLRGDDYFFRRGSISVMLLPEIHPAGADWSAAVALRDAVRTAIVGQCGEPELRPGEARS